MGVSKFGCALSERITPAAAGAGRRTRTRTDERKDGLEADNQSKEVEIGEREREEIPDQSMTSVTKRRHQTLQELIALKVETDPHMRSSRLKGFS